MSTTSLSFSTCWFLVGYYDLVSRRLPRARRRYLDFAFALGMGVVWFLAFLSTILKSPFLISISASLSLLIWIYGKYGEIGVRKSLSIVWLLLFAIPLPFELDSALIFRMQFIATQLASGMLDSVGQIHFREGVILFTESKRYLTEQACSGVHSLFSSLALIGLLGVYSRHSVRRQIFNLLQVVGWVIIGNAIRVALVVYGTENWTEALSSGAAHKMQGLVTFALIIILTVSTDHLIQALFFFQAEEPPDDEQPADSPAVEIAQSPPEQTPRDPFWLQPSIQRVGLVAIGFGLIGVIGFRNMLNANELVDFARTYADALPAPQKDEQPYQIDLWTLVDTISLDRGTSSLQAPHSVLWSYRQDQLVAVFSVDYPYYEWHNLEACYTGLGWKTELEHFYEENDSSDPQAVQTGFSRLNMARADGTFAMVWFSCVDRQGHPVSPDFSSGLLNWQALQNNLITRLRYSFGFSVENEAALKNYQLPVTGIQLYCASGKPISPAEQKQLTELFLKARQYSLQSPRFNRN